MSLTCSHSFPCGVASRGLHLLIITIKYYAIVSLHNINYKRGGFISNEIYISPPGVHDTETFNVYFQNTFNESKYNIEE